jgi:hypothetical protein
MTAKAYDQPVRWMRGVTLIFVAAGLLVFAGSASAVTLAPPGKSGADQYYETIPTSGGNAGSPAATGHSISGHGNGTNALASLGRGRAGESHLSKLGKPGKAAATLAAATAPARAGGRTHRPGGGLSASQIRSFSAPAGSSTASALASLLGGSDLGGLGFVLPMLLLLALLAIVAVAASTLLRRRRPVA